MLREVDESDAYANLVLPPLLRHRNITGRDAGFATELAYGTLRMRGRYDAIIAVAADRPVSAIDAALLDVLRLGVHQVLAMRVPAHAAVSESVALARARIGVGPSQFVNAVLRRVSEATPQEWDERVVAGAGDDPTTVAAVRHSHPAWMVRAMRQALTADGRDTDELDQVLAANNDPPAVTLVARPGLIERDELLRVDGARAGRWAPTAVAIDGGDPGAVPAVRRGRAGVQDEGSQLVTLAFLGQPIEGSDDRWLDLCAGPGGKTALLAGSAVQRNAHVVANELAPHRALLVERAVAPFPEGVVEVRSGDGRTLGEQEPGSYDRVLVDAPCTGMGALRRRPESRWRRSVADLPQLTMLQRELLDAALDAVRPGGLVGYVTCSPHVAETRLIVADVLRARGDAEQLDARPAVRGVADQIDLGPGPAVQLWPHVHGTDAMHLALLRRTGER